MIEHYQPFLFPFLSAKASHPNVLTKRYYYWSWEDGLWDLLKKKHVEKGSTILIPDFYCSDVVTNMKLHGYSVAVYKLDKQFQIKKQTLLRSIQRHHPAVIILFHACGITNKVTKDKRFLQKMTKKAMLIEDSVHQLLDPQTVKPLNESHFIMDSLRKVSPLYGSFLYGTKQGMRFQQTKRLWSLYTLQTTLLYLWFRIVLLASHLFHNPLFAVYAHKTILKRHDDVIGNMSSHRGIPGIAWISQWINRSGIERVKREQVKWYEHMMRSLFTKSSPFYRIQIPRGDYGKLHVYPVGLKKKASAELIAYLKDQHIVVWPKFEDSAWAKNHDVLFFPLGFHMGKTSIKRIAKSLTAWKTGEWKQKQTEEPLMSPHLLVRAAQFILSF